MTDRTTTDRARRIALLGAPIDMGASQRGTLMGPAALRTAGLATLLESLDFEVVDYGDLTIADVRDLADRPPQKANHYREIQRWTRVLSRKGYEIATTGALPIFLGGDHTLSMGSVNAMARHWQERGRELFVLWLDAHADYNTPETTITASTSCSCVLSASFSRSPPLAPAISCSVNTVVATYSAPGDTQPGALLATPSAETTSLMSGAQ